MTASTDRSNPSAEWTRVEVTGVYQDNERLLVRNRPYRRVFGYEVLVPFEPRAAQDVAPDVSDGEQVPLLLVDRGWVPNAETAATLPDVPAPPADEVTVTGWLRAARRTWAETSRADRSPRSTCRRPSRPSEHRSTRGTC